MYKFQIDTGWDPKLSSGSRVVKTSCFSSPNRPENIQDTNSQPLFKIGLYKYKNTIGDIEISFEYEMKLFEGYDNDKDLRPAKNAGGQAFYARPVGTQGFAITSKSAKVRKLSIHVCYGNGGNCTPLDNISVTLGGDKETTRLNLESKSQKLRMQSIFVIIKDNNDNSVEDIFEVFNNSNEINKSHESIKNRVIIYKSTNSSQGN